MSRLHMLSRAAVLVAILTGCGAPGVSTPPTGSPPEASVVAATPVLTPAQPGATFELEDDLTATIVQDRLEVPWDLTFLPDGRMVVTERPGRIRVFASPEPGAELLSTLEIPEAYADGEAGAMGITVDKEFSEFPYVYVCVSRDADGPDGTAPWRNEVLRFEVNADSSLSLDPAPLVTGMIAHKNHNGCAVEMDDGGHLWVTTGDASSVRSRNLSQVPTSLNGKVLRLHRDGSVPDDNPVLDGAREPTIVYSTGHRNPQGIAMRDDGLILVPEHGPDRDDEINRVVPGGNFGYGCYTGPDTVGPAQEQEGPAKEMCGAAGDYLSPAWASGFPTIATSGAVFLAGDQWRDWEGMLIVATLKERDLRLFEVIDNGAALEARGILLDDAFSRLRAAVIAPDGSLYITSAKGTSDKVVRVTRSGG